MSWFIFPGKGEWPVESFVSPEVKRCFSWLYSTLIVLIKIKLDHINKQNK